MEGKTMTALLSAVTEVFTFVIGKIPELLGLIASEPILLVGVGLMVSGAVFGFARRMIKLS